MYSWNFFSEYHLVPKVENIESIYEALCDGQSMNPDEEDDNMDNEQNNQIDLNNFVWADGYGPEFLTGQAVGPNGDGTMPNIGGMDVSS